MECFITMGNLLCSFRMMEAVGLEIFKPRTLKEMVRWGDKVYDRSCSQIQSSCYTLDSSPVLHSITYNVQTSIHTYGTSLCAESLQRHIWSSALIKPMSRLSFSTKYSMTPPRRVVHPLLKLPDLQYVANLNRVLRNLVKRLSAPGSAPKDQDGTSVLY